MTGSGRMCLDCEGRGVSGEDELSCSRCHGSGRIPAKGERIWRCEKDHLDDFHLSIEGVPERCSRCGGEVREYVPEADLRSLEAEYENLRLHRDRLWRERDELRADLRRLYGPGDLLQSSASRMAEYVRNRQRVAGEGAVPYEVQMAALESEDAVEDWTAARAALDLTVERLP